MADVTERGQLIVVTALVVTLLLVSLALLVNGVVYSENLASRGSSTTTETQTIPALVEESVGTYLVRVNHPDGATVSYTSLYDGTFRPGIDALAEQLQQATGSNGRLVSLSASGGTEGTRVSLESPGTFTPVTAPSPAPLALGGSNWQVVADAHVRRMRMAVAPGGLATVDRSTAASTLETGGSGLFYAVVRDADGEAWRIGVFEDTANGQVTVDVYDGSDHTVCTVGGDSVVIDFAGGALVGDRTVDCGALSTPIGSGTTANLYFVEGSEASGTFEVTADRHRAVLRSAVDRANGNQCSGGPTLGTSPAQQPYATPVIYSVETDVRAVAQGSRLDDSVRVAPGEVGPAPTTPRIETFVVNDTSQTTGDYEARYTVEWNVTDPDGDLREVTVTLDNAATGGVEAADSGRSGSLTYTGPDGSADDGDGGDQITVTVTATDGSTTRSATVVDRADGTDCLTGSNSPPFADFTISPASPSAGETVTFDASGSSDDGAVASYEWDLDDDGSPEATGVTAATSFPSGGHDVTLTVTDDEGATTDRTRTVSVGTTAGSPPTVQSLVVDQDKSKAFNNKPDEVEFRVDWEVTDPDADLDEVTLKLIREPDGARNVVDTETVSFGGVGTGDGPTTLQLVSEGSTGEEYEIRLEATDGAGNTASDAIRETADGS